MSKCNGKKRGTKKHGAASAGAMEFAQIADRCARGQGTPEDLLVMEVAAAEGFRDLGGVIERMRNLISDMETGGAK